PHAAIEKSCGEAAVHRARWIEMRVGRVERDHDTTVFGLHHVIAERLRDGVEGQRSGCEALDEFESAHRPPQFRTDRPVGLGRHAVSPSALKALTRLGTASGEATTRATRNPHAVLRSAATAKTGKLCRT